MKHLIVIFGVLALLVFSQAQNNDGGVDVPQGDEENSLPLGRPERPGSAGRGPRPGHGLRVGPGGKPGQGQSEQGNSAGPQSGRGLQRIPVFLDRDIRNNRIEGGVGNTKSRTRTTTAAPAPAAP